MPYIIISTVALLSNLYKKAPLIVGDKDSDPELMRYLGARITTNYPACGSPPMYVLHALPRVVLDSLEKKGYCLLTAQTIQEHCVWVLARARVPEDDAAEVHRGGPNDKSIQAFSSNDDSADGGCKRTSSPPPTKPASASKPRTSSPKTGIIASDSELGRGREECVKQCACAVLLEKKLVDRATDPLSSESLSSSSCSRPRPSSVPTPVPPRSISSCTQHPVIPHRKPWNPSLECKKAPTAAILANPLFANMTDNVHLACLTQCDGCCCEQEEETLCISVPK